MIRIEHLTYSYPRSEQPALQDIDLEIGQGEFVLLAGSSGAGKSTLLRCLNGLVPHFSGGHITGQVHVAGQDVVRRGPQDLSGKVGFVFQNPEAQAVLERVEEEIAFGLENAAIPSQEMRLRVEEVLNLLELSNLRNRPLSSLSGGERQRLAIASALALRPNILALDEPTSQLDPQSAEEVLGALVRLNEEIGLTIVLVEHRLERIVRYVDRLIYLESGRIVVDGPVRQVLPQIEPEQLPPLVHLGMSLGWTPLPLTIKEGLQTARQASLLEGKNGDRISNLGLVQRSKTKVSVNTGGGEFANRTRRRDAGRPETGTSLLEARELSFAYQSGRQVLRRVSLSLAAGETVALMGRNGSGKSTLLKCLVGLLKPGHGEVLVNGQTTRGRPTADICREVAYLPQDPDDLLFSETVLEELEVTVHNHGLKTDDLRQTPTELLNQLGLGPLARDYPRDLSVGQRQRVALGAVMVTGSRIMLLDEPTRGLDFVAKRQLIGLWQRWQTTGMGLILVTHDVEMAARVANRIVVLSEGEVIAQGPAGDVLSASPMFAPQMVRLFPGRGWLTVEDVLNELHKTT